MTRTLIIEFLDYWHAGGGRGAGTHLDAIVEQDSNGLPYVPGRQIKGILREAMEALEAWKHVKGRTTDGIFGCKAEGKQLSEPGAIGFGDATLPKQEADWLATDDASLARVAIYHDVFATAIEADTGTAKGMSLRGIEVVIPLTLEARISVLPGRTPPAEWQGQLEQAFSLVRAIGAHRSRGLGRAKLAWKDGESAQ